MRLYPDIPSRRAATLARDLLLVLFLVLLAFLALAVRDAVDGLAVLGEGVHGAGSSIQSGFDSAADAVGSTPLVGDDLARGLRDAGEGSGGNVADPGTEGEEKAHRLADLLTFLLPALFLLGSALPDRIDQIRRLTAASKSSASRRARSAAAWWRCALRSRFPTASSFATRATRLATSRRSGMTRS